MNLLDVRSAIQGTLVSVIDDGLVVILFGLSTVHHFTEVLELSKG